MGDTPMLTADQVSELVKGAVADAIKAVNTVAPDARPAAPAAPTVLNRKTVFPNVVRALRLAMKGQLDGLERDVHDASKALWYQELRPSEQLEANSVVWPRNPLEMLTVLREIGETKSADRVDSAIKAMTEVVTYTAGSGTAGGVLLPPPPFP